MLSPLPIDAILPELRQVLAAGRHAVVTAPPGSGKTTRVPLSLLDEPWLKAQRILLLEPRRLAARAAATFMARLLDETVGETVGYRIRLDTRIGPKTRIEVVTEGILTRLLQHDASLSGYGIVLFDEFHERSVNSDLGLALCLESQRLFRPDLRLVVMSATIDIGATARLLHDAPTVVCEGRAHPVETRFVAQRPATPMVHTVVDAVKQVLLKEKGSVLVFLPGAPEIRHVQRRLQQSGLLPNVVLAPLYGELTQEAQDLAIAPPPPGRRKVVLATNIAETSLTIEGVRIVIDAGLTRVPRFDPRTGLTRLTTVRVSRDSADQRRGRAGRIEPGLCLRLWSAADHHTLAASRPPEILEADLSSLVLELAQWGIHDSMELRWLDPPPNGALTSTRELLTGLGALDAQGRITPHGREMVDLAMHPRLAHMVLKAIALNLGSLACEMAALLTERDVVRPKTGARPVDLRLRLDLLYGHGPASEDVIVDRSASRRVMLIAQKWREQLRVPPSQDDPTDAGLLLAFAYPDRIAQRLPGNEPRYRLANGRGAAFLQPDPLSTAPYLVIAELGGDGKWAPIHLAVPITEETIRTHAADLICRDERLWWDASAHQVRSACVERLGSLVLSEKEISDSDSPLVVATLLEGIRKEGACCLPWTNELRTWRARVQFLRRLDGPQTQWPDLADATLLGTLEQWLAPFLNGIARLNDVVIDGPLRALLTREQHHLLDRLAPTHLLVPSGSRVRVDYESQDIPVLPVRLQELFGCRETPRLADGRASVLLHLLSPAGRPIQITRDLASFWAAGYYDVRKELRGRYPKHPWPDDPFCAIPTRGPKRR